MNIKQLKKLQTLRNKLFDAMVFDTNPENWVAYGKQACDLSKQEKDEASWCRRQASSSIALWEKIDKLIMQHEMPVAGAVSLASNVSDITEIEQEADYLLKQIGVEHE